MKRLTAVTGFLLWFLTASSLSFTLSPKQITSAYVQYSMPAATFQIPFLDFIPSYLQITVGILVVVLIVAVAVVLTRSRNRRHRAYPPDYFGSYYEPEMSELCEYEPMMCEEDMFEEEYVPQRSYGAVGNQYGRYATSMIPCPYCGHPVRGDQSICTYCHQRIA
ncbi:MAG: zinc ribbon domain-containing protein [Candidatus Bathyarchaeota archaeon]|nr:zinc ribbon domain-containing protein [Candidatus Bathyarchaeota archaeon]